MDIEAEREKLAYALLWLRELAYAVEGNVKVRLSDVPEKFHYCKGYGPPPGEPDADDPDYAMDCWQDWFIEFIDALSIGETIDFPEKYGDDDDE